MKGVEGTRQEQVSREAQEMRELLDSPAKMRALDPHAMYKSIAELPAQVSEAWEIAQGTELPQTGGTLPRSVIISGMGGSAIGGDLLRALVEDRVPVPVLVNRDYSLPAFAGPDDLVIVSSYSGNTEETLSVYDEAKRRGSRVVAVTSGGELARRAAVDGYPVVRIPGGLMPRAALGYSFIPLYNLFYRMGLAVGGDLGAEGGVRQSEGEIRIRRLRAALEKWRDRWGLERPVAENRAKQLALAVRGKLLVVYGSQGWKGTVAYRWKGQFNENGKNFAHTNVFPELNHNETVGWENPPELVQKTTCVILWDEADNPRNAKRVAVTAQILRERGVQVEEVWAEGESELERMFSLIYLGDWTSLYLAYLNGVDPYPIAVIDRLKAAMAAE